MDRQDLHNLLADEVYPVPTLKEATHNTLGVIKQAVHLVNGFEDRPLEGTRVFIEGVGWFICFFFGGFEFEFEFPLLVYCCRHYSGSFLGSFLYTLLCDLSRFVEIRGYSSFIELVKVYGSIDLRISNKND